MRPRDRRRRSGLVPGVDAYGFDGSYLGIIRRYCSLTRTIEVDTGATTLRIPHSFVGLLTRDFIVLRGTARELFQCAGTSEASGGDAHRSTRSVGDSRQPTRSIPDNAA